MNIDNDFIIEKLSSLSQLLKLQGASVFRTKAIDKSVANLKKCDDIVESGKWAQKNIVGVGGGIAKRIDEIMNTGNLKELVELEELNDSGKLDELNEEKRIKKQDLSDMRNIQKIYGIGEKNAKEYIEMNLRTPNDLMNAHNEKRIKLTKGKLLGIKYLDDFETRIPRYEVDCFYKILANLFADEFPEVLFEICGSYRRGQSTCGDIDVIISQENMLDSRLREIVNRLKELNIIVDDLANGNKKYMGVAKIRKNAIARRLDILWIPYHQYGPAILYFTGSKEFNIWIRNYAIANDMHLSEQCISCDGEEISAPSEEKTFELLNIRPVNPCLRNKDYADEWNDYIIT